MNNRLVLGSGFAVVMAVVLGGAACSDGGGGGGGRGGMDGLTSGLGGNATGGRGGAVGAGGTVTGAGGAEEDAGLPGCNAPQFTHMSLFGSSFDGWTVPTGNPSPSLAPMPGEDGGPPTGTVMSLNSADGSPALGSAKLEVPFSEVGQQLLFAQNYPSPVNLAGTTVTAQIRLVSGLIGNPVTSVARAFLVLKSTSAYTYATGVGVTLDMSAGWTTLTVSADAPSTLPIGHNPCDIREIDVEIDTGTTGTYTPAVILIDTIVISGSGGGADASMDAPTGS